MVVSCAAAIVGVTAPAASAGLVEARPLAGKRTAAEVREYWTVKRMREAVPLDSPAAGPAGAMTAADPPATASAAVERSTTTVYPYSAVGRLFFRLPDGGGAVCTASVINTLGDSFVLTASHCVYETGDSDSPGEFFTDVEFVPGYRNGARPFGEFPATELAVPDEVVSHNQLANDHGSVIVAPAADGRPVEDVVGGLGISLFGPPRQDWRAYGYPAEKPFDGERQYTCDSRTVLTAPDLSPPTIGISCDMTAGASGGPWVIQDRLVASDTSYFEEDLPGILFGPQLKQSAASLYYPENPVACGGRSPTIVGTELDDRIQGTKKRDVILGDAGDDVINGKKGNDVLCGESGEDKLIGAKGRDKCIGGDDADTARSCEKKRSL